MWLLQASLVSRLTGWLAGPTGRDSSTGSDVKGPRATRTRLESTNLDTRKVDHENLDYTEAEDGPFVLHKEVQTGSLSESSCPKS